MVVHRTILSANLGGDVSGCVVKKSLVTTIMTHSHSASRGILSCGKLMVNRQIERGDIGKHKQVLCDKHKLDGKWLLHLTETNLKEQLALPCPVILALHGTIVRCMKRR